MSEATIEPGHEDREDDEKDVTTFVGDGAPQLSPATKTGKTAGAHADDWYRAEWPQLSPVTKTGKTLQKTR